MMPVECSDANVIFDAVDTTQDDYDDTWMLYEIYNTTVGA